MSKVPEVFPPDRHLVRDLRVVIDRDESGTTGRIAISKAILDAAGQPRIGVLATLADMVAGETAIRAVRPDWIATSDLTLHTDAIPGEGTLEAKPRVIRRGRQSVVVEVTLAHLEQDEAVGLSTIGFSILPSRSKFQRDADFTQRAARQTNYAQGESGFRSDLLEAIGLAPDPENAGISRLPVEEYVINSLGAMQGGVVAILIDAAADRFAASELGGPVIIRGLTIHYLRLAREGPARAEARLIARTHAGALVRVELYDEGKDDELLTVATIQVDRIAPGTA